MTPYKDYGNLSRDQRNYNYVHSSTRMTIEHAFGAFKGRYRRLKFLDILDIEKAVKYSLTCCVFHELCLSTNDEMNEFIEDGVNENAEVQNPPDDSEMKRRIIMDSLT